MVKRVAEKSISEDEGDHQVGNQNGKVSDESNKDAKKRLRTRSLYRQPTVNELNRLQETESLFNSNLFRLQVEEILEEVKVKDKTEKKFLQWFTEFKNHLLSIPEDSTEYDLTEKALLKKLKVKLPISTKLAKTKCIFKFYKFNNIVIAGSYALECSINSKLRVDLQITVPAETYTKNDSINYRYHKKRAAYLAYIAAHVKEHETVDNINYSWVNGCESRPVLDITLSGKLGKYVEVRIDLKCEAEAYKLHRFSPTRNNLRESWLLCDNVENNTEVGPPTPYYNSSVLCDLTALENNEMLKATLLTSDNLKQAVVLLKIWLRQRNLQVSGYIVSLLISYLVQNKRINNIMSSYQIVRNVWIALKTSEWDVKGISLHKGDDSPPIEVFHQHFPVVFLDKTGYYNVCWQMCRGTYLALKRESALAVDMLDNGSINSFIPLFMVPVRPLVQFDHILRFKDLQKLIQSVISQVAASVRVNYGVEELALVTDTLSALFARGLGNRADLILQLVDADFSWSVKKSPDKVIKEGYKRELSFGFILNKENFTNIVEKGPSANLPEAEEFRAFWGAKSELRRFQDGAITEACVWPAPALAGRRAVGKQILDYLLEFKYGIPSTEVFHVCDQLETLLARKQYTAPCEESSEAVLRAMDDLRRDIRQLTQLPLDVSAVYGTSPVFSYCDPLPAIPRVGTNKPWRRGDAACVKEIQREDGSWVLPEYTPVNKAIVELGHSGKWPGDIEAFRCLKAAFHLQIADRMRQQHSLPTQAYPTHIDVLKSGLVFRLEIAHPKEITLLRKEMENGVAKFRESDESVKLQCETVLLPRLRGALHGLHRQQPAFGPTSCLFKRWLSSHLLSPPHFPSVLAELLTAATFLKPQPLVPAANPTGGLVRVLRLLADTDWATEMLVLDFNEDMKREEIAELERQFASASASASSPMRVVTAYDGALAAPWSARAPSRHVLARAQALARSTLSYLNDALLKDTTDNILGMFVPSLAGYDIVIRLRASLVPLASERVDQIPTQKPVGELREADVIPVVEFNPVERYLDELRSAFGEFALFFHDSYGGELIAVLWKPDVHDYKEFQIANANALTPVSVDGETRYKINTSALVEEFKLLGDGLVEEVTVHRL